MPETLLQQPFDLGHRQQGGQALSLNRTLRWLTDMPAITPRCLALNALESGGGV